MDDLTVNRSHRRIQRCVLAGCALVFLLAACVGGYALHVRASAQALISSASQIHSIADAERQAAIWRQSRGYEEYRSPDGTHQTYKSEVRSGLLSTLHLVPSTGVLVQVSTRSGELLRVVIGMYTEQSSVWIQEEFSQDSQGFRVDSQKDQSAAPVKTIVTLGSGTSESTRARAFALNANCLMKPGGCKNAEEMLSTIRQLESATKVPVATAR